MTLREKCPNTDQEKFCIWTLHAVWETLVISQAILPTCLGKSFLFDTLWPFSNHLVTIWTLFTQCIILKSVKLLTIGNIRYEFWILSRSIQERNLKRIIWEKKVWEKIATFQERKPRTTESRVPKLW